MGIAVIHHPRKNNNCVGDLYGAIFNINHTGQEHCGIVVYNDNGFKRITKNGLVRELEIPNDMNGYCGVGNVGKWTDHQPLIVDSPYLGRFALTFDGYIINKDELKRKLGGGFLSPYNSEVVGRIIAQNDNFPSGIRELAEKIKGCFCIGITSEDGESYAARCPLGIKPLMLGEGKNGYSVITESRAFRKIDMKFKRDFMPGEIVRINDDGIHTIEIIEGKGMKLCTFQPGYHAWIDSDVDGISVSNARERVAKIIAEKDMIDGLEFDISSAVEDSGKGYGEFYAFYTNKPYLTTIIKFPYFVRSYDRPKGLRSNEAAGKASSIDVRIKGKIIVIWDDSIRRGTVLEKPIKYLKYAGAKGIHLRIGTPRNIAYCRFDDQDAPDDSLLANRFKTDEEIAKYFEIDSVRFPEVDKFVEAITKDSDLTKDNLCLGCYTNDFGFLDD